MRYSVQTAYSWREFAKAGDLIGYGAKILTASPTFMPAGCAASHFNS
jgi:hypothetical protein